MQMENKRTSKKINSIKEIIISEENNKKFIKIKSQAYNEKLNTINELQSIDNVTASINDERLPDELCKIKNIKSKNFINKFTDKTKCLTERNSVSPPLLTYNSNDLNNFNKVKVSQITHMSKLNYKNISPGLSPKNSPSNKIHNSQVLMKKLTSNIKAKLNSNNYAFDKENIVIVKNNTTTAKMREVSSYRSNSRLAKDSKSHSKVTSNINSKNNSTKNLPKVQSVQKPKIKINSKIKSYRNSDNLSTFIINSLVIKNHKKIQIDNYSSLNYIINTYKKKLNEINNEISKVNISYIALDSSVNFLYSLNYIDYY